MSETMPDAPAAIEPMDTPAVSEGSMRDTMAEVLAKYPDRSDSGQFESRRIETDAPAAETTDQPEVIAAPEPAEPVIEAPVSWSAEKKAIWGSLPPEAREYIAQRESEAHKAISEKGARAKLADDFEAAIGVHKTALVSEYGTLDRAVNTLVNVAMQAGADPAAFIRWFSQQHRLDLAQLAGAPAQPGQQQHIPPAVDQRISTLEQRLEQQQMAGMTSTIRAFAEATDAGGKPMRPHFEAVREEMGRLMQAGVAGTLEQAYAKAIRTNDAVWATVQAEEAAAVAAKQKAEHDRAAKAAADAKRAASVNVKPVGSPSGSPVKGATMRDTMAAVARQHYSGNV